MLPIRRAATTIARPSTTRLTPRYHSTINQTSILKRAQIHNNARVSRVVSTPNHQILSSINIPCKTFSTSRVQLKSDTTPPPPPPAEKEDVKDSEKPQTESEKTTSEKKEGQEEASSEEGKEESKEEKKDKGKPPPPPPHGDKTPWMVFVDTLKTEFKQSKEWEESTKALASSANQFTESDAVKRAREAYEKSSQVAGGAASATGEVLKKTAGVVGKGAQWTWETPVVKAGRTAVKMTASGAEKVTRPIRETEVYKNVKGNVQDVLDDGSSSRYGGFLEREERRKAREARVLKLHGGKMPEKMEEDPKYVCFLLLFLARITDNESVPVPTSLCTKTVHGKSHGKSSVIATKLCSPFSISKRTTKTPKIHLYLQLVTLPTG